MGLAIKASREATKITREAGAEMVDISPRHLQSIELEGQYPGFELFIEVDKLLDRLDDKELRIIEATARGICDVKEEPD